MGVPDRHLISVITPSLPERAEMLLECIQSVRAQSYKPVEHLIGIDYERIGTTRNTNRLVDAAKGDWLAIVADDDLLLPHHLKALLEATPADIVYSEPIVRGEDWPPIGVIDAEGINQGRGTPPATCLIRTSLWRELGGYRGGRFETEMPEDMDFWRRAALWGADIAYVPEVTWIYRFHGANQSRR